MTGHVFHPGHDDLHGITVVVEGVSGRRYIGRWHEPVERGVLMHDVAVFDPAGERPWEDYLARTLKFGIRADHKHLVVPHDELGPVRRLAEFG
ncbi:MAG: hypothetical protein NW201_11685 [Gemmatimonadales bacterium]|nr:hypothetical protein [Gemmatimonadales bacterium]